MSVVWAKYGGTNQGVIEALRQIGEPVLKVLSQDLKSSNEKIRRNAAKIFFYLKDPSSYDILVKLLGDEDRVIREYAVRAIGKLNNPTSFAP